MRDIKQFVAKAFSNQFPSTVAAANPRLAVPLNLGDALLAPGTRAQEPSIVIMPAAVGPVSYCRECGQVLPVAAAQEVPATVAATAEPAVESVVDPDAERTDLAPRDSATIQRLLLTESPEQTQIRITNDRARYRFQQGM